MKCAIWSFFSFISSQRSPGPESRATVAISWTKRMTRFHISASQQEQLTPGIVPKTSNSPGTPDHDAPMPRRVANLHSYGWQCHYGCLILRRLVLVWYPADMGKGHFQLKPVAVCACKRGAVSGSDPFTSLPPATLRLCDSPHLDSVVTGRIGQHGNSP